MIAGAPESDGNDAVVGIESANSQFGKAASCFSAGVVSEGVRFTFTPTDFAPRFEWRDPDSGTLLGTGQSIFMPAEGRCDVRHLSMARDPESLCPLRDESLVTVPDIYPPVVTPGEEDLYCVWPPNHRWVTFTREDFAPLIDDNCSPFSWVFASCLVDPPDGDGDADCVVAADGLTVKLRAERPGGSPEGRRYGLGIVATDAAGNASAEVRIGHVWVPHDREQHPECLPPVTRVDAVPGGPASLPGAGGGL